MNKLNSKWLDENHPDGVYEFPHEWGAITLPSLMYFKEIQSIQSLKLTNNHASLLYKDGHSEYITLDRLAQRIYKYI